MKPGPQTDNTNTVTHPKNSWHQRLLTESVRQLEQSSPFEDTEAVAHAREQDGDFEQRLLSRAQALPIAATLETALKQLHSLAVLVIGAALILAALAGAATTRLSFSESPEEPVNFFWLFGSLLGIPSLLLLIWLLLILLKPKAVGSGSFGAIAAAISRRLNRRLHRDPAHVAAAQASASLYGQSAGTWMVSAISHAMWLSFSLGSLVMAVIMLSVQQYSFGWETTILTPDSFVLLTRGLAALPELIGFSTPSPTQITTSQLSTTTAIGTAHSYAWSGLLLGGILVYSVLPRALLLALCWWLSKRARDAFRLDTELPGYARLHAALMPISQELGVVDADQEFAPVITEAEAAAAAPELKPLGPAAILGLEIDPLENGWPPLKNSPWLDLGLVDDRAGRARVLDQIAASDPPPRLVLAVCSLAMTPDRGAQGFIARLQEQTETPIFLLLSEGQRMRERGQGDDLAQRSSDWRQLGTTAHIPETRILELDLDHLTAASETELRTFIGMDKDSSTSNLSPSHLTAAFALIISHIDAVSGDFGTTEQTELHRAIAQLYKATPKTLNLPELRIDDALADELQQSLQRSAEQIHRLLPPRLKTKPRWLAAGAAAGALGCVAIATLTSGAALAALPLWAGLGAALSMIIKRDKSSDADSTDTQTDLSEAVNAAALFALLLELQGQGLNEATITARLDTVLPDDPPLLPDSTATRAWLDQLEQRFNTATDVQAVSA